MSQPKIMRAIVQNGVGGTEVLECVTLPCPIPKADQVLIKVAAAGINRPDIAQRLGRYPVPADASPVLGLEVAGTVQILGANVTNLHIGQRVCALVHGGGYATYALADAGCVMPVPEPLTMIQAAALPEVAMTVEFNMMMRAGLSKGEWVLIHGGSSGIGSHAIQRAKAVGASVIVTAGSDEKCRYCLRLGADAAVNYRTKDFVVEVDKITNGTGVNVVLDMVGGPYVARNLAVLADDGRYALISLQGGKKIEANFESLLRRRLTILGSTLRPLSSNRKAKIADQVQHHVWPFIHQGIITPHIFADFPLENCANAHKLLEEGEHQGKIVLRMDEER